MGRNDSADTQDYGVLLLIGYNLEDFEFLCPFSICCSDILSKEKIG